MEPPLPLGVRVPSPFFWQPDISANGVYDMSPILATLQIILAIAVWFTAVWGRLLGAEPFVTWLYFFAWWPLVFFLDGVLGRLTERSLLREQPLVFLRMLFFSVTVWLMFEVFNLWLLNWRYAGVEPRIWLRWPGYALAFATVLPGILLAARVLAALGVGAGLRGQVRRFGNWQPLFLLLGAVCLVLPFLAPRYAFPLIWGAFFFLLDPLLDLMTGDSLTRRFLAGDRQTPLCLLLAGLACGIWWEMWNYPSAARWVYTLPVLNFWKIFEMPVLGFLGFLPFALECWVMYAFLELLDRRLAGTPGRSLFYLGQVVFWLVMFWALDARTVMSYHS
jgi:hypothetical protein|uniref:Uncharacterized protein n=1 Tax=Desulfobacca acetoxidans TaxID=60893 RepID=A0A7V6A2U5_9BACT